MDEKKKIKIYSTSTCPYCSMEKDWLREHNIEFEEIDVSQDQEAANEMVEKSGQMGVPVTEVDGELVVGFDKEKLKQLLGIHED